MTFCTAFFHGFAVGEQTATFRRWLSDLVVGRASYGASVRRRAVTLATGNVGTCRRVRATARAQRCNSVESTLTIFESLLSLGV